MKPSATAAPTRANARWNLTRYSRTWYRANPPLPEALWSQRDNNNYEETGLLTSLHYFNENKRLSRDLDLKSKRSIQKPRWRKARPPMCFRG